MLLTIICMLANNIISATMYWKLYRLKKNTGGLRS